MLLIVKLINGQLNVFVSGGLAGVDLIPVEFVAQVHGHCFVDDLEFFGWQRTICFSIEDCNRQNRLRISPILQELKNWIIIQQIINNLASPAHFGRPPHSLIDCQGWLHFCKGCDPSEGKARVLVIFNSSTPWFELLREVLLAKKSVEPRWNELAAPLLLYYVCINLFKFLHDSWWNDHCSWVRWASEEAGAWCDHNDILIDKIDEPFFFKSTLVTVGNHNSTKFVNLSRKITLRINLFHWYVIFDDPSSWAVDWMEDRYGFVLLAFGKDLLNCLIMINNVPIRCPRV